MNSQKIHLFITNTPKGTTTQLNKKQTVTHNKNGSVLFNEMNVLHLFFNSLSDFVLFHFKHQKVEYQISEAIGQRTVNGIVWFDNKGPQAINLENDSSIVFSKRETINKAPYMRNKLIFEPLWELGVKSNEVNIKTPKGRHIASIEAKDIPRFISMKKGNTPSSFTPLKGWRSFFSLALIYEFGLA